MTKHNLVIAISAMVITLGNGMRAEAQIFQSSGKSAADLSTEEIINQAEGDFNKDGIKDLFISNYKGSAFYFGKADGSYSLFLDSDLSVSSDSKLSVTDKGVLRIQTLQSDVFLFRYQDNTFLLIGGKHDNESYNFLTNKKVETIDSGSSKRTETFDMPKHPPFKYGWFPLDWKALWDGFTFITEDGGMKPDDMISLGIYRRMQLEERINNRNMCNLDTDYGRDYPSLDEKGEGSAMGTVENPFSYNSDCTVTFKKQPNGTFKIHVQYLIEERGYEGELYKYINEHPEYENLDFDEQLKKAGLTIPEPIKIEEDLIFNGKFIELK